MAYYHLSVKTLTPKDTCAAGVKADYILRQGAYAERGGLVAAGAGNMPSWVNNPAEYFYAADAHERANGRLCKTLDAEIPMDLVAAMSPAERSEFVETLIRDVAATPDGPLPYYWAIHDGGNGKMHIHAGLSERVNDGIERSPETWFRRANPKTPDQGGAKKTTALKPKEWLVALREHYADYCNDALREHGSAARIDHRSFADRGLDPGLATKHLGPLQAAMERRGIATAIGDYNRAVRQRRLELGIDVTNPATWPKEDKDNEQKDHKDNERAAAAEIRDDAGAAGRDTGQDGGRDVGASAQDEQRSGISITPGEKGLLTPRIIAAPPRSIEEQRAMEAWAAAQAKAKPPRPQETAEERGRRLCSRAPKEPEPTQPAPAQAAQAIEADAEEIARIIAEADAWDRRMAEAPPPADRYEHCDRARERAALHYRANKARRGIIVAPGSIGEQRAVEAAEEQAWDTYDPQATKPQAQAQDNNQDDNNPRLAWKRDLEAAGAPPPRTRTTRDGNER